MPTETSVDASSMTAVVPLPPEIGLLPLEVAPLAPPVPAPLPPAWLPDAEPLLLPVADSIGVGCVVDACEQPRRRAGQMAKK